MIVLGPELWALKLTMMIGIAELSELQHVQSRFQSHLKCTTALVWLKWQDLHSRSQWKLNWKCSGVWCLAANLQMRLWRQNCGPRCDAAGSTTFDLLTRSTSTTHLNHCELIKDVPRMTDVKKTATGTLSVWKASLLILSTVSSNILNCAFSSLIYKKYSAFYNN